MATATTESHLYRPFLLTLGIVFAALTIFYSAAWMYYIRRPSPLPQVEVCFKEFYSSSGIEIQNVYPNSPAEKSGLQADDRIVAINGNRVYSASA